MSTKLTGMQWKGRNGETFDLPAEALIGCPADMLALSDRAQAPILILDVQITRRLRAHVLASAEHRLLKAFGDESEVFQWCTANGVRRLAVLEEWIANTAIVWYLAGRETIIQE